MRYSIGVAFVGKNPPAAIRRGPINSLRDHTSRSGGASHVEEAPENPDQVKLSKEERRQTRFFIPEPVTLEVLDADGNIADTESTVTENISLGGAAVFTSLKVSNGSFIRITSDRHDIKIISVVRGTRKGADGLTRLHLEFIDHFFPLEGIE